MPDIDVDSNTIHHRTHYFQNRFRSRPDYFDKPCVFCIATTCGIAEYRKGEQYILLSQNNLQYSITFHGLYFSSNPACL